jgi:hypothetical protein
MRGGAGASEAQMRPLCLSRLHLKSSSFRGRVAEPGVQGAVPRPISYRLPRMHLVPLVPTLWIPGSATRPRNDGHNASQCALPSIHVPTSSTLRVDDGMPAPRISVPWTNFPVQICLSLLKSTDYAIFRVFRLPFSSHSFKPDRYLPLLLLREHLS